MIAVEEGVDHVNLGAVVEYHPRPVLPIAVDLRVLDHAELSGQEGTMGDAHAIGMVGPQQNPGQGRTGSVAQVEAGPERPAGQHSGVADRAIRGLQERPFVNGVETGSDRDFHQRLAQKGRILTQRRSRVTRGGSDSRRWLLAWSAPEDCGVESGEGRG